MAKKPNYNFEKRRKELERKAKRDEKLRNKRSDAAAERDRATNPDENQETPAAPE